MTDILPAVQAAVPRGFWVDVMDHFAAAAAGAKRAVFDNTSLEVARAHRVAGLMRHAMLSQEFEQLCDTHGGELVHSVRIDDPFYGIEDRRLFLSTYRFGSLLIGFASHRSAEELPSRTQTRQALAMLNASMTPSLFAEPLPFSAEERFLVVMVRRDEHDIGKIAALTVALLDGVQHEFLFQRPIEDMLASYEEPAETATNLVPTAKRSAPPFRERPGEPNVGRKTGDP